MNVIGIGIDIVDIHRIKARDYKRIAEFVFLPEELVSMGKSRDEVQFLASRFAAKEAVIKAYPEPLGYHDIYIQKRGVKPYASVRSASCTPYQIDISMAHELQYALAWATVSL